MGCLIMGSTYGLRYILKIQGDIVDSALARYYSSLNGVRRAFKYWSDKGFKCSAIDLHTGERICS